VVRVSVDPARIESHSRFTLGVTHTQRSLDTGGDRQAIARGKELLAAACRYHNVHIMGWGTMNPNPAPGVYDWESLDRRMAMVRSIPGAAPVITLCAAPDWMKGGKPGQTDWSKIEVAPLPEHYKDFADLAAVIARRYPDVRHFQVWNEFKGLWKASQNNWDYENYTRLYNRVYDALKAVNGANQIGGPYLVVEGTGSGKGPEGPATAPPITRRNEIVLDYWLQHKKGADFFVLDRSVKSFHDKNTYSADEIMALTHWFGDIARQVRKKTDLPLWWAEYYATIPDGDPAAVAAVHASTLGHMIRSGTAAALLWQPMDTGEVGHALFRDARKSPPEGTQPHPLHAVYRAVHAHFGPGTPLVAARSSSPDLEVLASPAHLLLVNKRSQTVTARVNDDAPLSLAPYEVRLLGASPGEAGRPQTTKS
jgi:hypothetical protein